MFSQDNEHTTLKITPCLDTNELACALSYKNQTGQSNDSQPSSVTKIVRLASLNNASKAIYDRVTEESEWRQLQETSLDENLNQTAHAES